MNESVCKRCGATFNCGVDEQYCWCLDKEKVEPDPAIGMSCLCSKCLEVRIEAQARG